MCLFVVCDKELDLIFVLDSSSSLSYGDFERSKQFVTSIIHTLNIGSAKTQVGMIKYSTDVYREFLLNDYDSKHSVVEAVDRMSYVRGKTYTADALKHSRMMFHEYNGGRDSAEKIVVLITDGESTQEISEVFEEANKIKNDIGAAVFVIGIGSDIQEIVYKRIASDPNDIFYYSAESFDSLDETVSAVISALICDPPLPETTSTSTTPAMGM